MSANAPQAVDKDLVIDRLVIDHRRRTVNKNDRKKLSTALDELRGSCVIIGELAEAEQDKFDNLPEHLQSNQKGEAIEAAAQALADAQASLEAIISELEDLE